MRITSLIKAIIPGPLKRKLKRFKGMLWHPETVQATAQSNRQLAETTAQSHRELAERVMYLEYQLSDLTSLLRYVAAPTRRELPIVRQTQRSFDFQWSKVPAGLHTLHDQSFRTAAGALVCELTDLPAEWFRGKRVVDVGCGSGRYSWALGKLGAEVLSIDQSVHGLNETRQACSEFAKHRVLQASLLEPLPVKETFDLVWSFGVLHHTGDTYGAFKNIVPLVRPGGYLFLMLYGEPRQGFPGDYAELNTYEHWRRKTRNMTLEQKLQAVQEAMEAGEFPVKGPAYVHGYFDAIAPTINDLYSWEEIVGWLVQENFCEIKRSSTNRNHHIIARKV